MKPCQALELWGGIECTVNRVGSTWMDQVARSGHDLRISDLDLFAGLGLRTLRYPFLWERLCPAGEGDADWGWAAERLRRMNELEIHPIAGLLHHGSGPEGTDLSDPQFPERLAHYATAFARRFPEINDYTPVNEPLTTARFSGLYGLWYPHGTSDRTFLTHLFNQCKGVVLAMREIRRYNPNARLVQTEDLGHISSTPPLKEQAAFENERRWLSLDLLCGKVTRRHPLWDYLVNAGLAAEEILWFARNPCPPGIMGVNHYITSNRHLDHRWELFPAHCRGGNGKHVYADTEAVRVGSVVNTSLETLLLEAWQRYGIPLAVTETHLACTREEQMRWLGEVWGMAGAARRQGADVRSVTAWGLLGMYDWHCLVTRNEGCYDPGVFDLSGGIPRPTALAAQVGSLATAGSYHHPLLEIPGWWHRDIRVLYPGSDPGDSMPKRQTEETHQWKAGATAPVLILGATGGLGQAFARYCGIRGIPSHMLTPQHATAHAIWIEEVLDLVKPWAVVNAAGYSPNGGTDSSAPHLEKEVAGAVQLAAACGSRHIPCITFTHGFIFDGMATTPYHEASPPSPPDRYADLLVRGEHSILLANPRALVIRTGIVFGPWDSENFLTSSLNRIRAGLQVTLADPATISISYLPDLVNASLDLLVDGADGVWHLVNRGETCQSDLVLRAAQSARLEGHRMMPEAGSCISGARPPYRVLGSIRRSLLPPLEDATDRYLQESQKSA